MTAILTTIVVVVSAGCGSPSHHTDSSVAGLSADVGAIRAAAANRDATTAQAELARLQATVATLRQQGKLSSTRATAILAAATDVGAQLSLVSPPSTTSTTNLRPKAQPAPAPHGGDQGKGGD